VEKVREPHQEPSEDIHVHILTRDEVKQLLTSGEIIQALHAAPLWKYFSNL
jgi:ADP-ribose pyrophosphatase